ncbi:MAG: putative rane protein [Herbinix sp.]|jgi:hypothetical protein|nr:putative rane protein [Herbinix sp.]
MSLQELYRYIGQTVTIFTTSGGASGCGFTGVLLFVNPYYVTLVNRIGTPPTNPLGNSNVCDRRDWHNKDADNYYRVGSVCDIPVDRIASFCHNAV